MMMYFADRWQGEEEMMINIPRVKGLNYEGFVYEELLL